MEKDNVSAKDKSEKKEILMRKISKIIEVLVATMAHSVFLRDPDQH
jgi:hypothetical protein